jgi:hypothetical protein
MILFEPSFLALPVTAIRAATDLAVIPETKFTTSVIGVSDILSSALIIGGSRGIYEGYSVPPVSGLAFGGRPLPGTLLMASKTSREYKLPLNIGSCFPRKILWATVLYGKPRVSAISSIVTPFMLSIIGKNTTKIIIVECILQNTKQMFSVFVKKIKEICRMSETYLDILSNTGYNIGR